MWPPAPSCASGLATTHSAGGSFAGATGRSWTPCRRPGARWPRRRAAARCACGEPGCLAGRGAGSAAVQGSPQLPMRPAPPISPCTAPQVTLVYAAKDEQHNNAAALAEFLRKHAAGSGGGGDAGAGAGAREE